MLTITLLGTAATMPLPDRALTAALAYAFTLFSGFGTYLTGRLLFPALLEGSAAVLPEEGAALAPYFTVEMPPVMGVMSALVLAFVLGLGMAYILSLIHISEPTRRS